jgi:hypothetical protein
MKVHDVAVEPSPSFRRERVASKREPGEVGGRGDTTSPCPLPHFVAERVH